MFRFFVFIVLTGLAALITWWVVGPRGQDRVLSSLQSAGFVDALWENHKNSTIYLDKDGFSLLHGVRTLSSGGFDVEKLELIGEIDKNGILTIAGWNGRIDSVPIVNIKTIAINLSTPLGAVLITGKANLGPRTITALLRTEQAPLSLIADIRAECDDKGTWQMESILSGGRFVIADTRLTRATGKVIWNMKELEISFNAGGLFLAGAAWKGIVGQIRTGMPLKLEAQALGAPEVTLTLSGETGIITTKDAKVLRQWAKDVGLDLSTYPKNARTVTIAPNDKGHWILMQGN